MKDLEAFLRAAFPGTKPTRLALRYLNEVRIREDGLAAFLEYLEEVSPASPK